MATVSKKVTSKDQPANTEAVAQRCSVKKVFLEISKNTFSYRTPLVPASAKKYFKKV